MENKNAIIYFEECTKTNIGILLDCALHIMCYVSAMPAGIHAQ